MTYPIPNYTRVWVRGRIIDLGKAALQEDNYGLALPVTFSPSPKVLLNAGTGQIISTASFKITPAAQDGYFAIQLPATDDPDINPTNFTYAVKEPTGRSYNIVVPAATPLLNSPGDPLHGQPVIDLITVVPSPPAGAGSVQLLTGLPGRGIASVDNVAGDLVVTYSDATTQNLGPVAGGSAVDLPEHGSSARTSADATVANLLSKTTRYDTTGGAISQALPAATAGSSLAIGWDAGTAALTLTRDGTDVIGSGAATSLLIPLSGEVLTLHCTTTGRWRVVSGFKPQAALDVRFAKNTALNLARTRGSALVRQMAAAPPHAPLLMDTLPVVTQGTSVTAGLTASYGADRVRWTGPLAAAPVVGGAMQPRGITNGATGAEVYRVELAEMWFDFDGRYLDISLRAYATLRYRVWVDGEAASADLVLLPSGTGANAFLKLDFGSARRNNPRRITVEFEDPTNPISILALRCAPIDYLAPSPGGQRWIWVGDSQARGSSGPTRWSFSFARSVGRLLGVQDFWHIVTSAPGTGLVHTNTPAVGNYGTRLQYDVLPYLRAGDVLVIQGSVNDYADPGAVGPALEAYVTAVRAAQPDVGIVVTGLAYIGTPDTARVTINTELKTKAAELGLPFVDPFDPVVLSGTGTIGAPAGDGPADWGRIADFTHFTNDGAWMFARRMAALISAAIGTPNGDLKVNKATAGLGNVSNLSALDILGQLQPPIPSGHYFYPVSPATVTAGTNLGNQTLRVTPWLVTRSISITRVGADVGTVGEAGSKLRIVLYADNGQGYPGALLVDAGQIAGDVVGVQELTISQTLTPGLYWIGGVTQSAPTTQPLVRAIGPQIPPVLITAGSSLPVPNTIQLGAGAFNVTGAAPTTFPAAVNPTSAVPRVFCRTA